jgi:hypothetical protein
MGNLKFIQAVHMVNHNWQFGKKSKESNSNVPTWECDPGNVHLKIGPCGLGNLAKCSWQTRKLDLAK